METEAREERYRRAYAAEPDTSAELAWAETAADDLLTSGRRTVEASPQPDSRKRRAAS